MSADKLDASKFASTDLSHKDVVTEIGEITREGISNKEVMKIYETWASTYDQVNVSFSL
jgi:hypothetical protein